MQPAGRSLRQCHYNAEAAERTCERRMVMIISHIDGSKLRRCREMPSAPATAMFTETAAPVPPETCGKRPQASAAYRRG